MTNVASADIASSPIARPRRSPAVATAIAVAAVFAVMATTIVSVAGRALGVSPSFAPIGPAQYIPLTLVGVVAGAVGWLIVVRSARNPQRVLRALVPAVLAVSLVPDIVVGASSGLPSTTWGGVATLMVMHVAVIATAVPAYRRFIGMSR